MDVNPLVMSEEELQRIVIKFASICGWLHFHDYRWSPKHLNTISIPGFPDIVLVREQLIFIELKSEKGRLTTGQKRWKDTLEKAGANYYLWRPKQWQDGTIEKILKIVH